MRGRASVMVMVVCLLGIALSTSAQAELGDIDLDRDVDSRDAVFIFTCLDGPGTAPDALCSRADINISGAVDLADWAILQNGFGFDEAPPRIERLEPLPGTEIVGAYGLDRVVIGFSERVTVPNGAVTLWTVGNGPVQGFQLNNQKPIAELVITLDSPIRDDRLTVVIDFTVVDRVGLELDGEIATPANALLRSGDGVPGGQAVFRINVLQGDANRDGIVDENDSALLTDSFGRCANDAGFDPNADLNSDGCINVLDSFVYSEARGRFLPPTDGVAPQIASFNPSPAFGLEADLASLVVTLNEPISEEGFLNARTLFFVDELGNLRIPSSVSVEELELRLRYTFDPPLQQCAEYSINVSNALADASGELLNLPDVKPTIAARAVPPPAPDVEVESTTTNLDAVEVVGSAPGAQFVEVAGPAVGPFGTRGTVLLAVEAGQFSDSISLGENLVNHLFFTSISRCGVRSAARAVAVTQDSTPPKLFIDFPPDGSELTLDAIDVVGRVGDLHSGAMGFTVTVNGQPAEVDVNLGTNGTFLTRAMPLALGSPTVIDALATDAFGNSTQKSITVTRVTAPAEAPLMAAVSGNGQTGVVHRELPEPVVIKLVNPFKMPFANKLVTFDIIRSNGRLRGADSRYDCKLVDEISPLTVQCRTDEGGEIRVFWTLGSDAGSGSNRIEITSRDVVGSTFFCASSLPAPARQINVSFGNGQSAFNNGMRMEVNAPACAPLRVFVNDGCNGVRDTPITFTVTQGSGKLNADEQVGSAVTVNTNATGHAEANFTLGPEPGNQRITATFPGNLGLPAEFVLYGVERQADRRTSFSGLVLSNANEPIQGCVCHLMINGVLLPQTVSDIDGRFRFDGIPSGSGLLNVNGLTATHVGGVSGRDVPAGSYPILSYDVLVVSNFDNTLPTPVLLPPLDPCNTVLYDGTQDVELTVKARNPTTGLCEVTIEGFKMLVKAGSMRRSNGTFPTPQNPAILSLNQVHYDNIPMPMPEGAAPLIAWTLQPGGAHFDPPVRLSYPNTDGAPPGSIHYFFSFDHDTNRFEPVATGHVVEDGSLILSDAGSGIDKAGWGGRCNPSPTGNIDCDCRRDQSLLDRRDSMLNHRNEAREALQNADQWLRNALDYLLSANVAFLEALGHSVLAAAACGECVSSLNADACTDCTMELLEAVPKIWSTLGNLGYATGSVGHAAVWIGIALAKSDAANQDYFALLSKCPALAPEYMEDSFQDLQAQINALNAEVDSIRSDTNALASQIASLQSQINELLNSIGNDPAPHLSSAAAGDGTEFSLILKTIAATEAELLTIILRCAITESEAAKASDDVSLIGALMTRETCQLSASGQATILDREGTFFLRGVPAIGVPVRVNAICVAGSVIEYGRSAYQLVMPNQNTLVAALEMSPVRPPVVVRLRASLPGGALLEGESAALVVVGDLSDGTNNVVLDGLANGTWYRCSNPQVAEVDSNGTIRARNAGNALVVVANEGATAVTQITVVGQGEVPTTVEGFVMAGDGTPVTDARVFLIGLGGEDTTGADGYFSIAGVPTSFGPFRVVAQLGEGAAAVKGVSDLITPVPDGQTDAGIIRLQGRFAIWLNPQGGNWETATNWHTQAVPSGQDHVLITLPGTYTVTIPSAQTERRVASLTFGASTGSQTLIVREGGALTTETLRVHPGGKLRLISGGSPAKLNVEGIEDCINDGIIELNNDCRGFPCGSCFTPNASTLSIPNARLINRGTLLSAAATPGCGEGGGGARIVDAEVDNRGTIQVGLQSSFHMGRLGAVHGNSGTISNGGALSISGASFSLDGGTISGSGSLGLSGTDFILNTDFRSSLAITMSSATLSGPGALVNTGTFKLINGTLDTAAFENQGNLELTNAMVDVAFSNLGSMRVLAAGTSVISMPLANGPAGVIKIEAGDLGADATLVVEQPLTNEGTIDLHGKGCCNPFCTCSPSGVATLQVNTGSLINEGIIRSQPSEGAGTRFLNAQLANNGTLEVNSPLAINKQSAHHTNSGIINAGQSLAIGGAAFLVNTGNIAISGNTMLSIPAGSIKQLDGTLVGSIGCGGGTIDWQAGASLSPGALTLTLCNSAFPAHFTIANGQSLQLNESTATGFVDLAIDGSLTLSARPRDPLVTPSRLMASGLISITGMITLLNSDLVGDLVNNGQMEVVVQPTLDRPNDSAVQGDLWNEGSLLVRSGSDNFSPPHSFVLSPATLRVTGDLTNRDSVILTQQGGPRGAPMTLQVDGTLFNETSGEIQCLPGQSGGNRNLIATLENAGILSIAGTTLLSRDSANHRNTGTIELNGGSLTINQTGTQPSITNAGSVVFLTGNSMMISGGEMTWTATPWTGSGNLVLNRVTATFPSTFTIATEQSLQLSESTATGFSDLAIDGSLTLYAPRPSQAIRRSRLTATGTIANGGTLRLFHSDLVGNVMNSGRIEVAMQTTTRNDGNDSTLQGDLLNTGNVMIRSGNVDVGNNNELDPAKFTVTGNLTNSETVILTQLGRVGVAGADATLQVDGTLLNESKGEIQSLVGLSGGGRFLRSEINNAGMLDIGHSLVIDMASAHHTNSGTISVVGGTGTVRQSADGTFTNTSTGVICVQPGHTFAVSLGTCTNFGTSNCEGTFICDP